MADARFPYPTVEMTEAEWREAYRVWGGLADSVRRLNEASLRTTISYDEANAIAAEIDDLTERLRKSQIPDISHGVSITNEGKFLNYGNAVVGVRNPIAPPLRATMDPSGRAESSFELNGLYEGPPGCVHGGVIALVLDQVLGLAAAAGGSPGMTGTLSIRYLQNTPLGACSAEAWIDRIEGVKTIVKGEMRRADGAATAEAEAIFILPRWARQEPEEKKKPPRFE